MRVLCTIITLLVFIITTSPAQAGNVVVYPDGSMQIEQPGSEHLDVTVRPAAQKYPTAWRKAIIERPGSLVPIEVRTEEESDGFYLITKKIVDRAVVYNKGQATVNVVDAYSVVTERHFNRFFIIAGIAIVLMLIANAFVIVGRNRLFFATSNNFVAVSIAGGAIAAAAATVFAITTAIFASAGAISTITFFAATIAATIAAATSCADNNNNKKIHFIAGAVFYLLMFVGTVLMYVA